MGGEGPEGELSISEEERGIDGSSGAPRKGRHDFLRFQKEQILYLIGRRIFGDPGRMEEIFGVLRQRKPDGTLGIVGKEGG